MDSNSFLMGWAFLATCAIGYFQVRASIYKKQSSAISFLLCEVVCGDIKPKIDGKRYIIEGDGVTFTFERKNND